MPYKLRRRLSKSGSGRGTLNAKCSSACTRGVGPTEALDGGTAFLCRDIAIFWAFKRVRKSAEGTKFDRAWAGGGVMNMGRMSR